MTTKRVAFTQEPKAGNPMSRERLIWCLDFLGWKSRELARYLDVRPEVTRQMMRGSRNIPNRVAEWIERNVSGEQMGGTPEQWRDADETAEA